MSAADEKFSEETFREKSSEEDFSQAAGAGDAAWS